MAVSLNNPENVLFFDFETAGNNQNLSNISDRSQELFLKRHKKRFDSGFKCDEDPSDYYYNKSPISPTYGKIVCASFGTIKNGEIKLKSFIGEEFDIVQNSAKYFQNANKLNWSLCGFNIKEFDLPWINRKCIKYGIELPYVMSLLGKKPWELNVFDIFEFCNSNKEFPTFDEICYEWDIESPKNEMSGDMVHEYFWNGQIEKIKNYCEGDVKACIELYNKIFDCQPQL